MVDSGWITIVPVAGIAGTGKYIPQYRKIGNQVHMHGYISSIGDAGTLVFTLPTGYRPTHRIRVHIVGDYLDTTESILRILETGEVYLFKTNNSGGYLNLDCVSFLTD